MQGWRLEAGGWRLEAKGGRLEAAGGRLRPHDNSSLDIEKIPY
jgi:hypothetical protein